MTELDLGKDIYRTRPGNEAFDLALLRAIMEASPNGILVVDEDARVVVFNQRFLDIWQIPGHFIEAYTSPQGTLAEDPLLQKCLGLLKDPDGFVARLEALYRDPGAEDFAELALRDGRIIERHSRGLFDRNDTYLGRVWFFRDVTERKQAESELRVMAWHDPLTGTLNRRHFLDRANEELERTRRYHHPLALVVLDLDHFKQINDKHGHLAGDQVLKSTCERWRSNLRCVDLLCRLGGEEFAVLLPDTELAAARAVAGRLRTAVASRPIAFEGQRIHCTLSAGVTRIDPDETGIEPALRRADAALYRAKNAGRNRVETVAGANPV
jgi:diguanylate cyclase (GGDEF)-like protein